MSAPGLAGSRFHGNDGLGGSGFRRGSRFGVCRGGPRSGSGMTGVWGFRLLPGMTVWSMSRRSPIGVGDDGCVGVPAFAGDDGLE